MSPIFFKLLGVYLAVEVYVGLALGTTLLRKAWLKAAYCAIALGVGTCIVIASGQEDRLVYVTIVSIWFFPKFVLLPFLLAEDMYRGYKWVRSKFFEGKSETFRPQKVSYSRRQAVAGIGASLAGLLAGGLTFGVIEGVYRYQLRRVKVPIKGLPSAFEGLTILQMSDFHAGTFLDTDRVKRSLAEIAELKSDVFVFTGDLVNDSVDELEGWMESLSLLKGKLGTFSVLGNHDFGDYREWPTPEAKQANLAAVEAAHAKLGWTLLNDSVHQINRGEESLAFVGIKNWSARNKTQRYGDLAKAMSELPADRPSILLSHDPTHWEAETLAHPRLALTLAGHTHGMQMGVEVGGVRISLAQWIYKQWAGLYQQGDQHIYVNRGFGAVGFPGRLGIWPEITEITLTKV